MAHLPEEFFDWFERQLELNSDLSIFLHTPDQTWCIPADDPLSKLVRTARRVASGGRSPDKWKEMI
jgi:hypothetical protein